MSGFTRSCLRAASLLAAALLWLAAPPPAAALTVLYTASLNGNLDGCDCKGHPRAGLAARAAWLRSDLRRTGALLVDAGDLLDVDPDPDLAREILETYAELGYDAVAVGDQELGCGIPEAASWRGRFALHAHNLALCLEDRCLFFDTEPLVLSKGRETVGLIALLDPQALALYPEALRGSLKLRAPADAAAPLVSELRARQVDWVVVLYHGPLAEAQRLARQVPGIDLVVVGHEQRLVEPRRVHGALVVSPGEEGNRLGLLALRRGAFGRVHGANEFRLFRFDQDPRDPQVLTRFERWRQRLRDALNAGSP